MLGNVEIHEKDVTAYLEEFSKAKDLAGVASEKAKSVSDSAKASMEIISEQREMEKNYRAIGEWFVSEYEGEVPDAVKDVVAAVIASFVLWRTLFKGQGTGARAVHPDPANRVEWFASLGK